MWVDSRRSVSVTARKCQLLLETRGSKAEPRGARPLLRKVAIPGRMYFSTKQGFDGVAQANERPVENFGSILLIFTIREWGKRSEHRSSAMSIAEE